MSTAHLIALFGVGCAANSLLAWLAAISPTTQTLAKAVYIGLFILLVAGLLLDDVAAPALKLTHYNYYGLLAMLFLTAILGGGLIWLSV